MLGSQEKRPVRLPMRLVVSIAGLMALAEPAFAQKANPLVADLRKDAPCSVSGARSALEGKIGKLTTAAADIDAALTEISGDTSICDPLRAAALDISRGRAGPSQPAPEGVSSSSREAVAAALAEAEHNANNLKFEVGPPPPNLTKGRNSGS